MTEKTRCGRPLIATLWFALGALWAGAAAAAGPGPSASAAPAASPGGAVIREGRYDLRYFGFGQGQERFTIWKTGYGYRIRAVLRSELDAQVSCESVYHLDENRRLVRASYRELTDGGASAEYRVENGVVTVDAWEDGESKSQTIELRSERTILTGPHYVTDFFVLAPLELARDERVQRETLAFGFEDWRVRPVELDIRRERDRAVRNEQGERVAAAVYRCVIDAGESSYKTRSWLDDEGVSLKISVDAPIGALKVRVRQTDD